MRRYRMVFEHDRAGRLVEAHEFEHLRIASDRFEPSLLADLTRDAGGTVRVDGDDVVIAHAYVERRVRPLNLLFRECDEQTAIAAACDYAQSIKDLAASNIFAGDLLTKNFGLTRRGRVVFYDYDELCLLTDCNFRELPQSRSYEEEMSAEPWFSVREGDIFPEEFPNFLSFPEPARESRFSSDTVICFIRNSGEACRKSCAPVICRKFRPTRRSAGFRSSNWACPENRPSPSAQIVVGFACGRFVGKAHARRHACGSNELRQVSQHNLQGAPRERADVFLPLAHGTIRRRAPLQRP